MSLPVENTIKASLACLLLVAVTGCTSGVGEVEKWVAQEKAKKGQPLQPPLPPELPPPPPWQVPGSAAGQQPPPGSPPPVP